MGFLDIVILVIGSVLVMFLPGLAWTYVLFDMKGRKESKMKRLEISEIILWSFGLSLAIVPFSFFLINSLLGVPLNGYTVLFIALGLTGFAIATRIVFKLIKGKA